MYLKNIPPHVIFDHDGHYVFPTCTLISKGAEHAAVATSVHVAEPYTHPQLGNDNKPDQPVPFIPSRLNPMYNALLSLLHPHATRSINEIHSSEFLPFKNKPIPETFLFGTVQYDDSTVDLSTRTIPGQPEPIEQYVSSFK